MTEHHNITLPEGPYVAYRVYEYRTATVRSARWTRIGGGRSDGHTLRLRLKEPLEDGRLVLRQRDAELRLP